MFKRLGIFVLFASLLASQQAVSVDDANDPAAREILAELIAVNTAPSGGNDTRIAVSRLVARLRDAGFADDSISVLATTEKLPNLVVRYSSMHPIHRPLLLMAHIDVVEALPQDWTVEPFILTEHEGYFYGRGTNDNKAGAAILIANLIRLKHEGFESNRDLIVMLTSDEESTGEGAQLLLAEHRELVDAEFALNTDGGSVLLLGGQARAFMMQTSEKIYASFVLEAQDPGGHSSRPRGDSAILRLARTLADLGEYRFAIDLNETTRAFFETWQELAPPEDSALIDGILTGDDDPEFVARLDDSPYYNALARTTCAATQISGGHAENALPQSAQAVVNCRVLPQSLAGTAKSLLQALAAPNAVTVTAIAAAQPSPPSPLQAEVLGPVTSVAQKIWPGIKIIPEMSTGATDGLFVRNAGIPVYAVSAIADDPDDLRAHGQDERIRIESFRDATEYWYRLVKVLSTP